MKKIIITFLVFVLSFVSVFADTTIDFKSDKNSYNIDDNIVLNIEVKSDIEDGIELKINGLDDFQVVGQNKSQSTQIINNNKTTSFNLVLSVLAKKAGDYIIGPIIIDTPDGEIKSKTLNIKVTGERIMVNSQINSAINNNIGNSGTGNEDEINIDDINLNSSGTNSGEIIPKKIIGINGKEMLDIYPPKSNLYGYLFSKIFVIFLVLLIGFVIIYYFGKKYLEIYLNKFLNKKEIKKEIIKKQEKKINYSKLLNELKKKYLNEKKEIFYAKLANIFRIYLDDKVEYGLSKKSLSELKNSKIINDNLLNIYEKIYFPEYDNVEDIIKGRENILEEIEKIIIKK